MRESLDVSDAHLRPWIPFMKDEPRSLEETRAGLRNRRAWFDRGEQLCYALWTLEGSLVGEALLLEREGPGRERRSDDVLEIGYWIDVRHVGQGYATEAARALVDEAFERHGCEELLMVCDPRNLASAAIPRKLGFEHRETVSAAYEDDSGVGRDSMVWARKRLSCREPDAGDRPRPYTRRSDGPSRS